MFRALPVIIRSLPVYPMFQFSGRFVAVLGFGSRSHNLSQAFIDSEKPYLPAFAYNLSCCSSQSKILGKISFCARSADQQVHMAIIIKAS